MALGFAATAVMGADGEPKKANKYQATGINATAECTAPDRVTNGSLPLPACATVDPGVCTFGDKGSAKIAAKAKDDVYLSLKMGGLESCPDGTVLQATASFKSNTNNCNLPGRCTTVTIPAFPIPGATCTVSKGKCSIKTSLNTLIPGAITVGKNTSIEIGSVGIVAGTAAVAAAGLLVP
jgi:hypothetical protein